MVPEADRDKYTLVFAADGTFTAVADCNTVAGPGPPGPGTLDLAVGPSTLVYCGDGSLSDLYILGLGNAVSYAVANGTLTITLRDQGTLVYGP